MVIIRLWSPIWKVWDSNHKHALIQYRKPEYQLGNYSYKYNIFKGIWRLLNLRLVVTKSLLKPFSLWKEISVCIILRWLVETWNAVNTVLYPVLPPAEPTGKLTVFSEWKPHITSIFRHWGVSVSHILSTKRSKRKGQQKIISPLKLVMRVSHSVHHSFSSFGEVSREQKRVKQNPLAVSRVPSAVTCINLCRDDWITNSPLTRRFPDDRY